MNKVLWFGKTTMMMTSGDEVVKVKREKLEACMTCPICNELFREATTISECLHTFCKRCIYDKIINDDADRCPVCKTDLGVAPLEKLRADNSLEDIRAKLFPFGSKKVLHSETRKAKEPEIDLPSISSPGRRKQRYLSSLGTSTPTVTTRCSTSGRRYFTRKSSALHESHLSTQEEPVPEHEDFLARVKSTENRTEDAAYVGQQTGIEKLSKKDEESNGIFKKAQPSWITGLNEAERDAARVPTKRLFFNLNNEPEELKTFHEHGNIGVSAPAPSSSLPIAKGPSGRKRKAASEPQELQTPAQHMVFDSNNGSEPRIKPIWFSLEAYPWEGYAPLPQIPSCYLRVKDGNLPSSFIKKYLVKKLNLHSEAEVEILLWGRPIHPTLLLHHLVDLWLQKIPASHKIETSVGSSAKEYVMVITYCRKVLHRW